MKGRTMRDRVRHSSGNNSLHSLAVAKRNDVIVLFKTEDEKISVDVRFDEETVWLTQQQISEVFSTSRTSIVEHIKHIYDEGELLEEATCRNFRQVRMEGNRKASVTQAKEGN